METPVHQDLPQSRGMGSVDRPIGCLPSHPHPPKLMEVSQILPQVLGVPVHLPSFQTGHSAPGLYNDRKGSEAHCPLQRTQTSPIPGLLADQVPVSGGSPSEDTRAVVDLTQSLGWIINQKKFRTESYSSFCVRGLQVPPRFSPCKTHSREMAQTPGFDPTTQVKTCFDCKMADLLSRSNQVQSTEWSLHPQIFKQICHKWFTPHVDLFATHLNHKLPLYVSPIPDPKAWDIDGLNIHWTGLTAYAYPPTALLHRVIQKIRQCHCLIIVIAPG